MADYDVFISYSRVDTAFVRQLETTLKARGREAWVDWQGIDYSTKWWDEICAGIESANNFVLVISPDSLNSVYCQREIAHARRQGKRIIPLIYRAIDEGDLIGGWYTNDEMKPIESLARENWEALKSIQWINHEKLGGAVDATASALVETVDSDPACVHAHTQLLLQARAWETSGRSPGALLSADVLASAEAQLDSCTDKVRFTAEQRAFVNASRAAEDMRAQRAEEDQRRTRRLRRTAIAAALVGVLALLASGGAVSQAISAQQSVATAQAEGTRIGLDVRRSGARLTANRAQGALDEGNRSAAMRLALDSLADYPTVFVPESEYVLSAALSTPGRIVFDVSFGARLYGATWNPDHTRLLAWGQTASAVVLDGATGERLLTLEHDPAGYSYITTALWSPDGSYILTQDSGYEIKIWDASDGALVQTLQYTLATTGAIWKQDGTQILTWGISYAALWDVETGTLQRLFDLTGSVAAGASWDPAEQRALVWGQDGTVRVFDIESGTLLASMEHAPVTFDDGMTQIFPVAGAVWNADGSRVLSWASGDSTAHVWDAATGEALLSLVHDNEIFGAAWEPEDGNRILTWSLDSTAGVWDATTGERLLTLHHDAQVVGARWVQDERLILTWSRDGTIKQWFSSDGGLWRALHHATPAAEDAFSPPTMGTWLAEDGRTLLSWGKDRVRVWGETNDTLVVNLPFQTQSADPYNQIDVGGAQMDETARHVLAWTQDGSIRLWDTGAGANAIVVDARNGASWSRDFSRVLTWSRTQDGGSAAVADAATGQPLLSITLPDGVWQAAWSSDETRLLTYDSESTVYGWDVQIGSAPPEQTEADALYILRHDDLQSSSVSGMAFSPDGRRVATWTFMGVLRVWDAADGHLVAQMGEDLPLPNQMILGPRGAVWSADSRRVLHWTDDGVLHIWDAETGESLVNMPHDNRLIGALWSADESHILSWSFDGTLHLWNTADGSSVFAPVFVGTEDIVGIMASDFAQAAVWNADETRILVATGAGNLEIYDAATGERQVRFGQRNGRVLGAAWSPDETRVLSWSDDGSVEVGDASTGATLVRVTHTASVQGAAWRADGRRILSWAWDNTARLWDAATGEAILLLNHPDWVMTAAWNSDETRLLTWTNFEAARIWDVTLAGMMAAARAETGS